MIDYTKIYLLNIDIDRLLKLSILDFKSTISKNTGEINENHFVAEYNHCKIIIKIIKGENQLERKYVIFSGSIHKMWNEIKGIKSPNYKVNKPYKGFNGNQFTLNDLIEARVHLEKLFECNASQMLFKNVEFGINIILNFDPKFYLKGLLYHKNIFFDLSHRRNNAQAVHQWFVFKIYNKSFQYNMSENVLRVELKIMKMIELRSLGINTFSDINQDSLQKVCQLLLNRFDEIMHYDYTIKKSTLSQRERQLVDRYSNPRYWLEELKSNHRDRHKKRLKEITSRYSRNLHLQIRSGMIKRCVMLNQLSIIQNV